MTQKKDGVSLRTIYAWIIVAAFLLSGAMFYTTSRLTETFESLSETTEDQIALEKAARKLMDASDYLTERAQRFTVDGDTRFLNEYFTEVYETKRREDAIEKMSADPKIKEVLEQLQEAMDESVALMNKEYYAMRLVIDAKGYSAVPEALKQVELREEDQALSPEEKMREATKLVLGDEYYSEKESIRADMQESLDALESLTRNRESQAMENFRKTLKLARFMILLQIFGTLFLIGLTLHLGINPILGAVGRIRDDRPIRETGAKEFRYLAHAYNDLNRRLNDEKELLKEASETDALTGIRNRMALRNDYDCYFGHEVTVMLMDLDNFKQINDTYGHEAGDHALSETGRLLVQAFQKEHCYRYGGDEFLIIAPDYSEAEFVRKLNTMVEKRPVIEKDGEMIPIGYSYGYVHGLLDDDHSLRELFSEADQKMYQIKNSKQKPAENYRNKTTSEEPAAKPAEYTAAEMKKLLESASQKYDLARVVDPIECRILEIGSDGAVSRKHKCYGIWNSDQKCVNCSSALACRTGCRQVKTESFKDQLYHIESNPVRLKLPDGGAYDAVMELVSIDKENQNAPAANDRAAENRNNRGVRFLARHDSLTNVLNPNAFSELCREAMTKNPDLPWIMITSNIMNFRLVNTLFGSQRGNEVIVRNAAVLQEIADISNGFCGRLGNDQFALLLPKGMYREEQLRNAAGMLKEEFSSGQYTFRIHFGVYEVEDSSVPISVMCDRANTALRTIHENVRETIAYFTDDMMKKILFEQEVISSFEQALEERQFEMYLQPLASAEGRISGAEALVRWRRPDGTLIMPGDFVETLENAGLIHHLDRYIWECAARQIKEWQDTGIEDLTISVNMSVKDLYNMDVYAVLNELVERYAIPIGRLKVEITETALLEDPQSGIEVISKLRRKGFFIEIDDFGKGYSSLSLLKDIHADVLKIDMSLLHEIEHRERNRMILESIINMAVSLGMEVIAEGVETEKQLQTLKDMGCSVFQGYYFSKPIPTKDFDEKYTVPGKGGGVTC
ncbi:MAG: EAL domain-containing protein [Solobacterium sp.]|nr:EAL domain-containing protein [Solobacterium sp.]